jgi:RimJ/RimL family protein N-acetyltransferase
VSADGIGTAPGTGRADQILRGAQAGDGPERFSQTGRMYEPLVLEGNLVRLEPLGYEHVDELLDAAGADRTSFRYTWVPADRPAMTAYVAAALVNADDGNEVPFATRSIALDRVVGSTRFYELERWDWPPVEPGVEQASHDGTFDRVSIGHTWLAPAAQRSPVNTEAKLLMLDHAFTRWGARAVRLQTDARNKRSRTAMARIGCTLDGVLRSDRPAVDGSVRDSAIFSMTADEWPGAKLGLQKRLAR